MKGYGRLQKVLAQVKSGELKMLAARDQLMHDKGSLNRAAFNLAVEEGLCIVCAKYKSCIVHDSTQYNNKGMCTWFSAVKKGS